MSAIVQIGFDGKAVTSGLAGLETRMKGFAGSVGKLGNLGGSLGAIGGALGLGLMVKRGFEFNQTVKDSEVAIGNVLAQFQGLNEEAAKGQAAAAMEKIIKLEPEAAGSLTTLIDGFLATLGAAQAAGLSVDQNIDLVGKFANTLANANIPAEQLAQEMRSILSGNIGADSTLAKVLSISNDDVNKAQQAGKLYDFLLTRIGRMGSAGDTAGVAFSTLGSAIDKALGAVTQGLFGEAVSGAKEFSGVIEEMLPLLEDVGKGWAGLAKAGRGFFEGMIDAGAAIMMTLDSSQGGTMGERWDEATRELDEYYKQRKKKRADAEADEARKASQPGTSGPGLTVAGPASSAGARAASDVDAVEKARQRYAEAQFSAIQRRATMENQIVNLAKQEQALREQMNQGPMQEETRYGILTELIGLEEQRLQLQKQIDDKAAEESKNARDKADAQQQGLAALMAEAEIMAAKAAGQDELVAKLEREQAIRERAAQIAEQTGVTQDKALTMAQKMQDLIEKAEKRQSPDSESGRRKIMGYSWDRQGGTEQAQARADQRRAEGDEKRAGAYKRGFGGLDYMDRINAQNAGGGRNIPLGKAFSGGGENAAVGVLNELKELMSRMEQHAARTAEVLVS